MIQANQSVITDLSKLGKPGDKFVHDFFLPGTQLTFPQSTAAQIAKVPGVDSVSSGLVLAAVHQEGTVPEIVAKIKTGGDRSRSTGRSRRRQRPSSRRCRRASQKAGITVGGARGGRTRSRGGRPAAASGGGGGAAGGGPERVREVPARAPAALPRDDHDAGADAAAGRRPAPDEHREHELHDRGRRPHDAGFGIVTSALVTNGRFINASEGGRPEALLSPYASRQGLKVGSKLDLNGTVFTVVGLVRPPLGGQTADVYVPLAQLQVLASQKGTVNVLLVRAEDGASVGEVQKQIEALYPRAEVASAKQVADSISGSLVDAASLSKRLGTALAVLAALAAFLLAVLLTLSSVGKRVRELGTLKALGWTQWLVVRQVVGESLAQGVLGGLLGVVLGVVVAASIGAFGPTLTASSSTGGGDGFFGLGEVTARTVTDEVALTAPIAVGVLVAGLPARRRRRTDRRRRRRLPRLTAAARRRAEAGRVVDGRPLRRQGRQAVLPARPGDDRGGRRRRPADRRRRVRRARRPERLRQDDAAAAARRARPPERRHRHLRGS